MPIRPLALRRSDVRIVDRITREQILKLILAHPTAEAIAQQALLIYHPHAQRNAFRLYGLGLALERMNLRQGEEWRVIGSQLDPEASQMGFDMIALSEGPRAVTDLPWKRAA